MLEILLRPLIVSTEPLENVFFFGMLSANVEMRLLTFRYRSQTCHSVSLGILGERQRFITVMVVRNGCCDSLSTPGP